MNPPAVPDRPSVELDALIELFYSRPELLGTFREVDGAAMPAPYRQLLDHQAHMTVTVEEFHKQKVTVRVHRYQLLGRTYQREITLHREDDGQVVQYGIVRLNREYLAEEVWQEIAARQTPLGRVLIQHNVLREVELIALWQVTCGPALAQALACSVGDRTYGRTALIHCDGQPAIELLEIVVPYDSDSEENSTA